jgi:integrase
MKLPNGYGSVVFLGKKRRRPWAARLTVGWNEEKKQVYKYLSYHEKRTEAFAALVEYNKNPYDLDNVSVTFADVFNAWAERKFPTLSTYTVRNYKSIYNKCVKLYNMPFRDIKTTHLQRLIDENKTLSQVGLFKALFAHLYGYAIKNDITEKDYSQFVEIPTRTAKTTKETFTAEEVATLWAHKDEPFVDLVLILLYTGMRISELLQMKTENINIDGGYMVGGVKTDAGKNRVIPIHAEIMPLVKAQFSQEKKYLFTASRGGRIFYPNFIKENFTPLMQKLKMDHTPHETRHTFISQADRCGINSTILKRIVGHANGDITLHYTHKETAELLQEINKFHY